MNSQSQKKTITITHLYPEKMNLYGDLGNVITLKKRLQWRGFEVIVKNIGIGYELNDINTDIYFFGGGQDQDQTLVYQDLQGEKGEKLKVDLAAGTPMLAICGGYQLLGQYFLSSTGKRLEGLGFLPIETVAPSNDMKERAVGNIVTLIDPNSDLASNPQNLQTLVGFENHSGRTKFIDKASSLGKVIVGQGDNTDKVSDGIIYNNCIGTYMHGSVLPKNPHLADHIISKALARKFGLAPKLEPLDDSEEIETHRYLLQRFKVNQRQLQNG